MILSVLLLPRAKPNHTQVPIVFTHATIIDVTGATPRRDATVVITGDRISAIGDSANVSLPAGAQVVDWYSRDTVTLFIANGVTSVRQMFGNSDLLRWCDQIAKGSN